MGSVFQLSLQAICDDAHVRFAAFADLEGELIAFHSTSVSEFDVAVHCGVIAPLLHGLLPLRYAVGIGAVEGCSLVFQQTQFLLYRVHSDSFLLVAGDAELDEASLNLDDVVHLLYREARVSDPAVRSLTVEFDPFGLPLTVSRHGRPGGELISRRGVEVVGEFAPRTAFGALRGFRVLDDVGEEFAIAVDSDGASYLWVEDGLTAEVFRTAVERGS